MNGTTSIEVALKRAGPPQQPQGARPEPQNAQHGGAWIYTPIVQAPQHQQGSQYGHIYNSRYEIMPLITQLSPAIGGMTLHYL